MTNAIIVFSLFLNIVFLYKYAVAGMLAWCNKNIKLKSALRYLFLQRKPALIVNLPSAYLAKEEHIHFLSADQSIASATPLPANLIIPPHYYAIYGKRYALMEEGLYRFMFPENKNHQVIVYKKNVAALMSALAWIISHGEADDVLSYKKLILKAQQKKLHLTCEATSRFVLTLLSSLNIPARVVATRTLEQWNTYDDGHYLIEVYRTDLQKWVLYDLDHDCCFMWENCYLSLIELMTCLEKNYTIEYISNDTRVVVAQNKANKYDFSFISEGRIANLKNWYKRILQFVYIEEKNENYSYHDLQPQCLQNYPQGAFPPIHYLDKDLFIKKFYPKESYE